jgi:Fe-S cluster assembly protein SufD
MDTLVNEKYYLNEYKTFEEHLNGYRDIPFHPIRKEAIEKFAQIGFPNKRMEDWKYTDISPMFREKFKLNFTPTDFSQQKVQPCLFPDISDNLVFINGYFNQQLSSRSEETEKIFIKNLPQAFASDAALVNNHLAKYAEFGNEAFIALNTAFAWSGVIIVIPDGMIIEKPVHLLHLSIPQEIPHLTHPRTLIVAGKGSQFNILESYDCLDKGSYFNNSVTEIVAKENSVIQHVLVQNENHESFHISNTQIQQERNSVYTSIKIDLGGALVRNNINVRLSGENAASNLFGFYLATGRQHIDNFTQIDHAVAHCNSNELYKGILDGKARGVFCGTILVQPDAQKTNAFQSNKNLLLSGDAEIDTKPQLKIFADDVKCSHGATIGQMDESALFYLQQRGISLDHARQILRQAFAGEVINKIDSIAVREKIKEKIKQRFGEN